MAQYRFPDEGARAKHHEFIARGQALSQQLAKAPEGKKAAIQQDLNVHMGRHQRYLAQYEVKPGAAAPAANGGQAVKAPSRRVNLDTARSDADEIEARRNSGSRGGVRGLDMNAIAAADQELEQRSKTAAGAREVSEEREGMAIQTGRNRFDVDAQPVASPAPAAKTAKKAPSRPAAPVTTSRKAPAKAPVAEAPQAGPVPAQSTPSPRPTGAVNPAPMAPTPETATPPTESGPAKAAPQRYGRFEPSGQGTLFGVSNLKGTKDSRAAAGRGLAFGEGAGTNTEGPSGPIRGDQPMFTEKGNPTRVTGATASRAKAPAARPARAAASKPAEAQAEEPVLNRPKAGPARPGTEGVGAQSRHVESPSLGETGSAPSAPATGGFANRPGVSVQPPSAPGSVITRRDTPRPEGHTGKGGRGVWAAPGVERTTLNGAQAAEAAPSAPSSPSVGSEAAVLGPDTGEASVSAPKPTGRGRTNVATPRDTSPARSGVHIEGDSNIVGNNSGNTTTTHNTYNYHIGGDVNGNVGGGGTGGGRVPRVGGGRAGGGSPRAGGAGGRGEGGHRPDKPDIWVNDVNGHHSLREGYEHITGQADSAGRPTNRARAYEHAQRTGRIPTSSGGQQRPIGGSPRTAGSGGASGTGTNFNWTGPAPTMGTQSSGGSTSGPSFGSGNGGYSAPPPRTGGGYGTPGTPVTPGKPDTLNWDED